MIDPTQTQPAAVYHGTDLAAAYARAKEIGGAIVCSTPPAENTAKAIATAGVLPSGYGYWSDTGDFIRSWEREVFTSHQRRSLAAVQAAEDRYFAR